MPEQAQCVLFNLILFNMTRERPPNRVEGVEKTYFRDDTSSLRFFFVMIDAARPS